MKFRNYLLPAVLYLTAVLFPMRLYGQGCYESSIRSPTPFMGNNEEIFKLADGSLWEVKHEYEYLYEYYPDVVICPNKGKLIIKDKTLKCRTYLFTPKNKKSTSAQTSTKEKISYH